ncbi:MAG: hypothetical protein A2X22_13235 [Bacteroidetes bacterium GWF2_49_14]|nr:MAG: hypothetical protein A2X22_13235 [Bacteroidetes bacterium GWF2_49_14]HBB92361.1 shikimate dehydrogenase [Bacteroidales bacterium]
MDGQRKLLGLIGFPLKHSFSQRYFTEKFNRLGLSGLEYRNFEMENISALPLMMENHKDLIGFNVTIPYKEAVLDFMDEIETEARIIGAVNVVRIDRSKGFPRLSGYNTDRIGIDITLNQWDLPTGIKAMVLGTGGSSKAVTHQLASRGIPYLQVSRKSSPTAISYAELTPAMIHDHKLLINCTPVGMYPDPGNKLPLAWSALTSDHFLFDLIYNPDMTGFLREGLEHGASIQNGLRMLHEQAEASWHIWAP